MGFSAATDPWIRVLTLDGTEREVSIRDALCHAHEYRALAGDAPMQDTAISRLLLAVLHRVIDGPRTLPEWVALRERAHAPVEEIDAYLATHHDRFLIDGDTPFFQTANLYDASGGGPRPEWVTRIAARDNAGLWIGYTPTRPSIPEALRHLVTLHAFDIAGIKTGLSGDPETRVGKGYPRGSGWCARYAQIEVSGDTLWDTLTLRAIPLHRTDTSRPAWELPPTTPGDRKQPPSGRLDLYTWQSRRVLLTTTGDDVTAALVGQGDSIEWIPNLDPFTATVNGKGWRAAAITPVLWVNRILALDPATDSTPPRIITALDAAPPSTPVTVTLTRSWQGSKGSAWQDHSAETITLHPALFSDPTSRATAIQILTCAIADVLSVGLLLWTIQRASGALDTDTTAKSHAYQVAADAALDVVTGYTRQFLSGEIDAATWHEEVAPDLIDIGRDLERQHAHPKAQIGYRTDSQGNVLSSTRALTYYEIGIQQRHRPAKG